MQIHDFSIAFTEMVIQGVWLFISIVFSLLKLPITYLPAIECNILSLQKTKYKTKQKKQSNKQTNKQIKINKIKN
jgi:hypothetical protein